MEAVVAKPSTPPPKGALDEYPLPAIYVHVVEHALSGSLVLLRPDGETDVVVFAEGAPTRVRTAKLIAPLGEMMVRLGVIANVDLEAALFRASTAKARLGQQLISEKVIDRRILLRALREQVLVRLRSVGALAPRTRYEFHANTDILEEGAPTGATPCDPLAGLLALVRGLADEERMDAHLASLEARPIALHPQAAIDRFELDDLEKKVMERVAPGMTYGALLRLSIAPRGVTRALMYALSIARHLDDGSGQAPLDVEPLDDPMAALRDSSLNAGVPRDRSSAVMRSVGAADDHREALALLRAENFEAAETLAHRAVERDPLPDHRALLGYVRGLRAKDKPQLKAAIKLLDGAIADAPKNDKALVYRANLYRRGGREESALRDFAAAAAINGRNDDATRELRRSGRQPTATRRSGPVSPLPPPVEPLPATPPWTATRSWLLLGALVLATIAMLAFYLTKLRR